MSLLKKLAGETAIYGLSSIVGRLLNYLLVPMYTRVFLKEEYGQVVELYAYVGFLTVLFTYRMETGFFRFGTPKEDREKTYSTTSIALLISTPILAGLMIFFAQPIANILQYDGHHEYIIWFTLVLAFDALSAIPFAKLRLDSKPWRFAFVKLTNIAVNIGLNCFFLLLCPYLAENGWDGIYRIYDPEMGIGYIFLANLVASLVTLILLSPSYFKIKWTFDKVLFKKIMIYAAPLIIVGFASVMNELLDRVLLKWLLTGTTVENEAQLGIYGASYKLAMLLTLFTQAFNYAAEPFFFSNANKKDSMKVYAQVAQVFTIIGCLGFLGIMLYIDIAKYFVGKEFRDGLHVVPILLMANLSLGLYYNFAIWYKLKDKTNIGAMIAIGGALITLVLNLIWIPRIGFVGSAWATCICYASMATASYLIGQRYYPVPYPIRRILTYISVAVVLYLISAPLRTYFGHGSLLMYLTNTTLLGLYLAFIYKLDGRELVRAFRE